MISISNLHKQFGSNKVLKGIDLNFDRPGITAILGPNGSGKTTLIKCLLGMVLPDEGRLTLEGQSIRGEWEYRSRIDYLPQIARFPDNLSVRELIRMIGDIRGQKADAGRLIELFELDPFLDQRLKNLSGGTRQKVNLTLTLMHDSPLLILDEPTSGLDPVAMVRLKRLLHEEREKGKTILITTHIMNFVEEMADDIVFLLEGKIYFRGSLSRIKEQYGPESLEEAIANILQKRRGEETIPTHSPARKWTFLPEPSVSR
ncbi:MAG: ABC transporter ATP-binding protein [Saprospiraceae bacterium]|nr:ABC transporter ATP-binding protein [Saprospiraceae bacterium]